MTLYIGSIDKALWIHKTEEKALSYENLTWKNSEQLFVAQELINKVKFRCCGI